VANTYTQIYLHIVFSTKNRLDWIRPDLEARVWEYIGGIARNHKMHPHQIGGIDNHVHALVGTHPTVSPSDAAKYLKGASSGWIHDEFSDLKRFAWQDGYGAFSVSKSAIPDVKRYIQNQREHHKEQTFEEEFLQLLKLHGIEYDERYVFG
jgi:REP element-mobilizing transposase RayT